MKLHAPPHLFQVRLILVVGVLAISTAAIFIRLAIDAAGVRGVGFSLVLAASRLTIAAIILLPAWKRLRETQLTPLTLLYSVAAGVFLALHFATWITSLSYTSIAASTTLVTTSPVWVTFLSWLCFGEKPTRLTVLGIGVALVGAMAIGLADTGAVSQSSNPLLGDLLALVGSWSISLYFLFGREAQRRGLGIGAYAAVAYSVAAVVLLPLPLAFKSSYAGYPNAVYVYILLMALFPQLVGHTSFNWAVRWISPTLVALATLFESVGSSILGYFVFGELPGTMVMIGAAVLLGGVAVAAIGGKERSL
jgi:drug/metabolite transporter (DMT)-like permease